MVTTIPTTHSTTGLSAFLDQASPPQGKASGWDDIVRRLDTQIQKAAAHAPSSTEGIAVPGRVSGIAHLGEMMKLQVDVHRAQMRVELLSKVSESAMAAMRKLQQNQ